MNWRWRIALFISDHVNRSCWANLGTWAAWKDRAQIKGGRWKQDAACASDLARNGACWCGKLRSEGSRQTTIGATGS